MFLFLSPLLCSCRQWGNTSGERSGTLRDGQDKRVQRLHCRECNRHGSLQLSFLEENLDRACMFAPGLPDLCLSPPGLATALQDVVHELHKVPMVVTLKPPAVGARHKAFGFLRVPPCLFDFVSDVALPNHLAPLCEEQVE